MVKINLMRFAALAFTVFFMGTSADAQTKIWGVGSAAGVADAEFSAPFINTGAFTAGDNPGSWTALSVNENVGTGQTTVTPGNAYWVRNLTGNSIGAYNGTAPTPVSSPSRLNGVALFDSDFLDNDGVAGAFGTGTSPAAHRGELISPRIDLTGYTDSSLTIQFYTLYRDFRQTELSISVSTDDGQNWTATNDFRSSVANSEEGFARILFNDVTAGVANLTQCRIRFTFDGNYYFALVDDITIEISPEYDLALGNPEPGGTTVGESITNAKVGSNRYNALDNIVHANDLREFLWGSKAINNGSEDILPSDSAAIHLNIDFTDPITGAVITGVYTDVMYYDSVIVSGDIVGQTVVDHLDDISFISVYGSGDYRITYWLDHKNLDGNTANDTTRHTFTVTDDSAPLRNYVSKARLSIDGGVFASRSIFPGTTSTAPQPFSAWEYGSVYFFPRGETDTITIDSVGFRYYLPNGFTGDASQTLFCNVYELDPSNGVLTDGTFLLQTGLASIPLTGLGTTTATGAYHYTTVTGFVNAGGTGAMPGLKDNSFYYVSILTDPSLTTGGVFGSNDVPWLGADDGLNYSLNANETVIDSVINPSPISVTDAGSTPSWNWVGFGADIVPSIGLFLDIKPKPVSVSTVYAPEGATFNVYPNPATDVLNFNFEAEEATDVMYILTDLSGRVLNITQSTNVTSETKSIDVSNLPAGVYMLTAKAANQNWTEKVIIN
jgi:hypothetical protein